MKKLFTKWFVASMLCLVMMATSTPVIGRAASNPITITKTTSTLKAGTSFKMKASLAENAKGTIKWAVNNTSLATIDANGKLTGKKVGTVTVTASCNEHVQRVTVKITPKKIIGIDAGHQLKQNTGKEPIGPGSKTKKQKVTSGTAGVATKVAEYELNLTVAKKLKKELENRGYAVVMTRTTHNVNISNKERAVLLNKSGADIAIRLHADGSNNRKQTGASALHTSTSNKYVAKSVSKKSSKLANAVINSYCKQTKIKNRGCVVRDDLTGNNYSKIPTFVLEMGFMSNAAEDRNMQKKATQTKMVIGIANGIDSYYKK